MQTTLDIATVHRHTANKADVQRLVNVYLTNTLGDGYGVTDGVCRDGVWSFLIGYCHTNLNQPCNVGRVSVNIQEAFGCGAVIPLTDDQLQEIRECADWEIARVRGELARDQDGYVSRHQARRLARRWLDQHLSMKYSASGGIFIPLDSPVWQFSITFSLQELHLEPLGVIDVDARCGDVRPLSNDQIQNLRERARVIIQHRQSPTAR